MKKICSHNYEIMNILRRSHMHKEIKKQEEFKIFSIFFCFLLAYLVFYIFKIF